MKSPEERITVLEAQFNICLSKIRVLEAQLDLLRRSQNQSMLTSEQFMEELTTSLLPDELRSVEIGRMANNEAVLTLTLKTPRGLSSKNFIPSSRFALYSKETIDFIRGDIIQSRHYPR